MPDRTLTVAMATYQDYAGCWMTLQGLRAFHGWDFDVLVLDNAPRPCPQTRAAALAAGGRYFHRPDLSGTSASRDRLFDLARTPWVLVCDSHVLFGPGAIAAAVRYAEAHPDSRDVVGGPMVADDHGDTPATHWRPVEGALWGEWAHDPRGADPAGEPFEVPMQGLGCYLMRKAAYPGFHPLFKGFGGEEGYLHEKVRQCGGKALCLPALRWHHRFRGPSDPAPYRPSLEDHTRNLLLGHRELGVDAVGLIRRDFGARLPAGVFDRLAAAVEAVQPFGTLVPRRPRLKLLGVWYSNNAAPTTLLQKSLGTVAAAAGSGRHDVRVGTCSWQPVPGNPFSAVTHRPAARGHAAILEQIDHAMRSAMEDGWEPDAVVFLEHDVLYPADYFDRVGDAFLARPDAPVVSNLDYEGLNATGWLAVKERHEPLHQLAMRYDAAVANLARAREDCDRQGWALLEPQGGRSDWARLPPRGVLTAVHVNHTEGRLTSHGEVCYAADSGGRVNHPYWGHARDWWPGALEPARTGAFAEPAAPKKCGGCNKAPAAAAPAAAPTPPPPADAAAWLARHADAPSDCNEHLRPVAALAAKAAHATELLAWNKPWLAALAQCPGPVVSVCPFESTHWPTAERLLGDRLTARVESLQTADLAPTDLLVVDAEHRAQGVYDALARHQEKVAKWIVVHCTETFGETGDDRGPGVMPGVRRFLREFPAWKVRDYSRANHGLIVLTRAAEDRRELPGLGEQAKNFLKAKVGHLLSGGGYLPLPMAEERLAVCATCPERQDDRCTKCGCYLEVVGAGVPGARGKPGRAFYPNLGCPIGKWHPVKPE